MRVFQSNEIEIASATEKACMLLYVTGNAYDGWILYCNDPTTTYQPFDEWKCITMPPLLLQEINDQHFFGSDLIEQLIKENEDKIDVSIISS